ncbi:MAG: hypothetical protein NZ699_11265 [Roseiflexus sp.]|nr:hypothetical protein [Roseiflexus sp.]MCS7289698.1 hypothetical protein [Roseiflexus sp.]MDW8148725.1 hypothetical protein [Roseiflexaceae bacterium]
MRRSGRFTIHASYVKSDREPTALIDGGQARAGLSRTAGVRTNRHCRQDAAATMPSAPQVRERVRYHPDMDTDSAAFVASGLIRPALQLQATSSYDKTGTSSPIRRA